MKKYDIENFYVGELFLSYYSFDNLLAGTKTYDEDSDKLYKDIKEAKLNGAIDLQKHVPRYSDDTKRRIYERLFTIFYKSGENYLCLHNNTIYKNNELENNFCNNLYRLDTILPKVSYNAPEAISMKKATILFQSLFTNDLLFNKLRYKNDLYPLSNFYLGNLNLYIGHYIDKRLSKYIHTNLPTNIILRNKCAFIGLYGGEDEKGIEHDYKAYYTLFLKTNDSLYDIHGYQMYNVGTLGDEFFNRYEIGESYYDKILPLEEMYKGDSSEITIPESLKLYKKSKFRI